MRSLAELPQPVRAFYEAGPTGFALYRAGRAAGLEIDVIAPGKTARPRSDRVKTDRKDAALLARLGLAGQLRPIAVPSEFVESARHLMRARERLRGDLLRARHRGLEAAAPARSPLSGADELKPAPPSLARS